MRIADATAGAWIPGRGPDPDALARIRASGPRPVQAMGEAWFMGETRRMFPELLGDLASLDADALAKPLWEIATGLHSFGPADDTWVPWFHYLLGALVPRAMEHRAQLLPLLVSGVVACDAGEKGRARYAGFHDDVLATLGRVLVEGRPWERADDPLGWTREARRHHDYWHAVEDAFAASAFLQARYLPAADVPAWIVSMLDLPHPVWHGQVLPWLVGIHPMLVGDVRQPKEWSNAEDPRVEWETSYALTGRTDGDHAPDLPPPPPALPAANRAAILDTVRRRMNHERLCAWLDSFKPYPSLNDNLFDVPERFARLYLD